MRTITKEIQLYKFEELSDKAKDEVRYSQDLYILSDYIEDYLNQYLGEYLGLNYSGLEYSLNYSQGDGVCFKLDSLSTSKLRELDKYNEFKEFRDFELDLFCSFIAGGGIEFNRVNSFYSHARSYSIELSVWDISQIYCRELSLRLVTRLELFIDALRSWYIDIQKQVEDYGYSEIEYLQSDEWLIELCECNGYEFTQDGKLY